MNYKSDSDDETYYSYNDDESYYEYEEEEEPEQVFYQDEEEEDYYTNQTKPVEKDPEDTPRKPSFYPIPTINPWTKLENNLTKTADTTSPPKSFLEIMEEEAILETKRKEAEEKKKQDTLRFRTPVKKGNEKRHYRNSNFNSNTSNKPVQSLLLSHKMRQKKV